MIHYQCELLGKGFLAKTGFTLYTSNREEARIYKTKQNAARALNYKSWDSNGAKQDLKFFEVDIEIDTMFL